jgi:membrane-associated phospholipid phosphatase
MNTCKMLIIALLCFITVKVSAQMDTLQMKNNFLNNSREYAYTTSSDSLTIFEKKNNDAVRIVDAFAYTMTSPIRWERKDWMYFGGSLVATSILSLADEPTNDLIQRNTSGFYSEFADFGYHNGKPYAAVVVAGGFYLTGLIIKDEWTKETAVTLTSAYMTSGVLQTALKKIVGRARPSEGLGPYTFHPFKNDPGFSSFPSGHSQIAFVTSMVLAERVNQPWLKAVFYSGAAMTMASRMYANAHWLSDVSFGGFLGYVCTKTVMNRLQQNKYKTPWSATQKNKIAWTVYPTAGGFGVVGSF